MKKDPPHTSQQDDPLNELRSLMMGPVEDQFGKIQQMLNALENQEIQADEVSRVLPEAILLRSSRDKQIIKAMETITEETISSSVKKDPRIIVDVLVPVMIPAIRKAITSLIKEMIQSFSATLEHGLSMRGLKWRFEAFKTKKPFGEVALLHSLVYQVEQVFLIHRDTGLVLWNVAADEVIAQDADMISSMLTAIQDFVRDSFSASHDDSLETLQFGDRSIWIEQSSQAVLAAVVRGNAPVELQTSLRETLDAIHFEQLDNLRAFNGDTDPFAATEPRLTDCLKSQRKQKKQNPFIIWSMIVIAVSCIGYWIFISAWNYMDWKTYLEKLHDAPGIVITETEKKFSGNYYIFGLRDTLADDPASLLKGLRIKPEKVKYKWELYHSSHPDFVIRRIKSILRPPETITFELKDNILYAKGSASHQWVVETGKLVESIPGILGFHSENIIDTDLENIDVTMKKIEKTLFLFDTVSTRIKPGQENLLDELTRDIKEINRLAQIFDKRVYIEITGHTDSVGTDEKNREISQKRAEELASAFVDRGLKNEIFTIRGVGANEPLKEELSEADREYNRSVSFKLEVTDKVDEAEPDLAVEETESEQGSKN
ncbi:MAG: OmpA family protein [Desulfobacterales bacterium]|nr:OmpA family protein [Desulfobacterales bacterium]